MPPGQEVPPGQVLVKKSNARLQLLRKIKSFKVPMKDLKLICITFIRSILEKCALKVILEEKYKDYSNALNFTELDTLSERR